MIIETIDLRPLQSFEQDINDWVSQNIRPDLDQLLSQARTWEIGTEWTKPTGFIVILSFHNDPFRCTTGDIFSQHLQILYGSNKTDDYSYISTSS
jgi:hypothetical protein